MFLENTANNIKTLHKMSLIKKIYIFLNQEAGRGLSKRLPAHVANKPE